MGLAVRPADLADLARWDARVVEVPGGSVHQSRAWARHRARFGWEPRFLMVDEQPVLVLGRAWRGIGGGSAYLSRGPIPTDDLVITMARIQALVEWLGSHGADVVSVDPEIPAATGFPARLAAAGFRPIEEIQPTRHRLDVALPTSGDEAAVFGAFSATTRNLIRRAEREALVVQRVDQTRLAPGSVERRRVETLYDLLHETSRRRRFYVASRATYLSWMEEAIPAGLAFLLMAERPDGEPVAAASFHRHGGRLSYALAGERTSARRDHPGATRLLLWRAMQVALAEGRSVMDLGGVDVPGARRLPVQGEPEYGLLQFKESFGARWVEMTGAHERVVRAPRYLVGRLVGRLARTVGRSA